MRPSAQAIDLYKKKRESRTRLLVPLVEALVLPGINERANTQRSHAEYETHHQFTFTRIDDEYIHIHIRHLLSASFLTIP